MIMDHTWRFTKSSTVQTITGATTTTATNQRSTGSAINLGGGGLRPKLITEIGTIVGTTPTLNIQIHAADDSGLSTNSILVCETGVFTPISGQLKDLAWASHDPKLWHGVKFVTTGSGLSIPINECSMVLDSHTSLDL